MFYKYDYIIFAIFVLKYLITFVAENKSTKTEHLFPF